MCFYSSDLQLPALAQILPSYIDAVVGECDLDSRPSLTGTILSDIGRRRLGVPKSCISTLIKCDEVEKIPPGYSYKTKPQKYGYAASIKLGT